MTEGKERKGKILEIKKDFGNSLRTRSCKRDFEKSEGFKIKKTLILYLSEFFDCC